MALPIEPDHNPHQPDGSLDGIAALLAKIEPLSRAEADVVARRMTGHPLFCLGPEPADVTLTREP